MRSAASFATVPAEEEDEDALVAGEEFEPSRVGEGGENYSEEEQKNIEFEDDDDNNDSEEDTGGKGGVGRRRPSSGGHRHNSSSSRKKKGIASAVASSSAHMTIGNPDLHQTTTTSRPKRKQSRAAASLELPKCRWRNCLETFETSQAAREHEQLVHVNDARNLVCEIEGCGKSFATNQKLQRHFVAHLERQFACTICQKKFLYSWDLKRHEFLHTGERPFRCPEKGCTRSFTKAVNCEAHILTDHKKQPSGPIVRSSSSSSSARAAYAPPFKRTVSAGDLPERLFDKRGREMFGEDMTWMDETLQMPAMMLGEHRQSSGDESGGTFSTAGLAMPNADLMFASVSNPARDASAQRGRLMRTSSQIPPPLTISSTPFVAPNPPSMQRTPSFPLFHHHHPSTHPQYLIPTPSGAAAAGSSSNGGGLGLSGPMGSSGGYYSNHNGAPPSQPHPMATPSGSSLQQRLQHHPILNSISPPSSIASLSHLPSHHSHHHAPPLPPPQASSSSSSSSSSRQRFAQQAYLQGQGMTSPSPGGGAPTPSNFPHRHASSTHPPHLRHPQQHQQQQMMLSLMRQNSQSQPQYPSGWGQNGSSSS